MCHVDLPAAVLNACREPRHDAAAFRYLAQHHCAGIARQPVRSSFGSKRLIETGSDGLSCLTCACVGNCFSV